ncbi:DUF1707 domain-containing protein [Nocardioides pocheonensis]|uniref:DUF1707 domain-containing protein n=1 Tax=Nocardioides pocheonensis TaxID=661485 RepID=A0A3N0GXX5_9ACTN|nr:DUF1707 domain-containing protein [Nocardioides pocheonensis]RNM17297.1 DUF1707 domain-containing protein [Nocardioides pocheonensis]
MDDPHRTPGARDRDPLAARVRRAAEQGRITTADRDIRLANVAAAQSMAELDLIGRDLDQLEAALPASTTAAPPWVTAPAGPSGEPVAEELAQASVQAARSTARSFGVVAALIVVLALVGLGARYFSSSGSSSSPGGELFSPAPAPTGDTGQQPGHDSPSASPTGDTSAPASTYGLTGPGIRGFLADYQNRFGTTLATDLTLYDDYVVVQVPHGGPHRHAGYLFRPGPGWTDFGGVGADFPGAQPVDLTRLDVPALVRNVARARRTLKVENPTTTYVIVRQYAPSDAVPSVDIHVSNQYGESGYLATRLDGTVERAFPYGS